MTHDSQRLRILRLLSQGEVLTTYKAFAKLKCTTLSQRCTELRKQNWPVRSRKADDGQHYEYFMPPAQAARVRRELQA